MTNFTKRQQAKAKKTVGRGQIAFSKHGRGAMGVKLSNADRLNLSRAGVENLIGGTIASNRLLDNVPPSANSLVASAARRKPKQKRGKK